MSISPMYTFTVSSWVCWRDNIWLIEHIYVDKPQLYHGRIIWNRNSEIVVEVRYHGACCSSQRLWLQISCSWKIGYSRRRFSSLRLQRPINQSFVSRTHLEPRVTVSLLDCSCVWLRVSMCLPVFHPHMSEPQRLMCVCLISRRVCLYIYPCVCVSICL